MKNIFKFKTVLRIVGFIAMAVIIGFSMTACDDAQKNKDTSLGGAMTSGRLTITGLSAYDNRYIYGSGTMDGTGTVLSLMSSKGPGYAAQITGGSVILYVYSMGSYDPDFDIDSPGISIPGMGIPGMGSGGMDFTESGTAVVLLSIGNSENTADGTFGTSLSDMLSGNPTFTNGKGSMTK